MNKKLIWLDDIRNPFQTDWIQRYAPSFTNEEIIWLKDYNQFISYIKLNGLPDMICFDHDLGEGKSGYDAAKFVVDYCLDNEVELPKYNIQSSNPVGKENINGLFISFLKR